MAHVSSMTSLRIETEDRSSVEHLRAWQVLSTLYLAGILSANAMAAKLFQVGSVIVTSGALAIPLVYLTTDLLNELYGPKATRTVVWMGMIANVVLVAMSQICIAVPTAPIGATQEQFRALFDVTPRIVIASMTAYLVSSLLDVKIFHALRKLTKEKHFWLRKNGSTAASQLVDSVVFVAIAFLGQLPLEVIAPMALGQYLVKIAAAPLGTPLSYAVLKLTR